MTTHGKKKKSAFFKSFLTEQFEHLIAYFIAIGGGAIISSIVKNDVNGNKIGMLALVVIVLFLIFIILRYTIAQTKDKEYNKGISVQFKRNDEQNDHAYQISKSAVSNAENSITIVADFSPTEEELVATKARNDYYLEIENIIKNKIKAKESFTYKRIMQRMPETYEKIKTKFSKNKTRDNNILDEREFILGDIQAFAHCHRIFELIKNTKFTGIKLEFYVTTFIPSLPSILIIDGANLLFTIPKRLKKVKDKTKTAGVIKFHDHENGNAIINDFQDIVASVTEDDKEREWFAGVSMACFNNGEL